MMQVAAQYAIYPVIDAVLNGTSAVLLLVGRSYIKRGRMAAHRAVMITALISSALFLTSYLYYHWHVGSVHFQGQGWSRPVYFSILISHTILAIAIVPLVIITLSRALRAALRPASQDCPLDFPALALCVGDRGGDLRDVVSLVCGLTGHTEMTEKNSSAFSVSPCPLW